MSTISDVARNPRRIYHVLVRRPYRLFALLFTDPDEFFRQRMEGDGLKWEALLIVIGSFLGGLGMLAAVQIILEPFGGIAQQSDMFVQSDETNIPRRLGELLFAAPARVAGSILMTWVLYSVGVWVLTWLYNGQGSLKRTLKAVAWGIVPAIVGYVIYHGALGVTFFLIEVETELEGTTSQAQFQNLLNQGRNEPGMLAVEVVLIVLVLASLYFMQYAVRDARDVSLERARIIAAVPVVLHAIWLTNQMLQHWIWS